MRVCIPVESNSGNEAKLAMHFGMAPFFALYDTEAETLQFTGNKEPHKGHGACSPVHKIGRTDINCIICATMGKKAVRKFSERNITIYKAEGITVAEIIQSFSAGNLVVLEAVEGCRDSHKGKPCSSNEDSCEKSDCSSSGGDCGEGSCQPPRRFDV